MFFTHIMSMSACKNKMVKKKSISNFVKEKLQEDTRVVITFERHSLNENNFIDSLSSYFEAEMTSE